jgi:diguanylate cyclase (GGDEF)-like protein/PAS domain S-box-containing protein
MDDHQQRLHLALEAARMAIWDSQLTDNRVIDSVISWSADGAILLGLPSRPFQQSFTDFLALLHPDDRKPVTDHMQRGVDQHEDYEVEYRVLRPDGKVRWIAARARILRSHDGIAVGTLGIAWDITQRKHLEQENAERKEMAEITLGSIGDGVITTDAQGKTRYMNRVAEQVTGWTLQQARGQDIELILKLVDESGGKLMEHIVRSCLRQQQSISVTSHAHLVTREGRQIALEDSAAPIRARDGVILGAVVVFRDVSHERELSQQLSWQASHDALTGLINRREFETLTAEALHGSKGHAHVHALMYMDLDQFKIVNDTCGHVAGDLLLQMLAKMLQSQMRDSDILARLGGDELGVLLTNCPAEHAREIAEQLRRSIQDFRFAWDKNTFELGVSIGLVQIDQHSKSTTELLVAADQACYVAKESGRNRIHVFEETDLMLAQRQGEMSWVTRLNDALNHQLFRLYAMPISSLRSATESHDEVLIRIVNERGEMTLPGAFIPAAERYDMMKSIDRWVIQAVCHHIKSVRDSLPMLAAFGETHRRSLALYSINLSGLSLNDPRLHEFITEQFVMHEIAPEQICFEITETAVISNLPAAQQFMSKLKAMGCRFSLDDFGSGLSSFAYLKALPVDYLKIDGIFVRDIANNAINRALVKAINEVGHVMGIQTVAEYVEDEAGLNAVRDIGIDYAQGHAVGDPRPMTVEMA